MKFWILFLITISTACCAGFGLGDFYPDGIPKRFPLLNGCKKSVSPAQKGGIDGAPSWQEWWGLMKFCESKGCRSNDAVLDCFRQTFESRNATYYDEVFAGFLTLYKLWNGLYQGGVSDLNQTTTIDDFSRSRDNRERSVSSQLARYDRNLVRAYEPHLATYNKLAIAWIRFLQKSYCTQGSEDGNTGVIKLSGKGYKQVFFHIDGGKAYIILPDAITWSAPLYMVNFYFNASLPERVRSFVCSREYGIQSGAFLRISRILTGVEDVDRADPFAFKVVNGGSGTTPYSSAAFFAGIAERQEGNVHENSSPIYPLIREILGSNEDALLPLVDDSFDPLDIRALELEIAAILARDARSVSVVAEAACDDSGSKVKDCKSLSPLAPASSEDMPPSDGVIEPPLASCVSSDKVSSGNRKTKRFSKLDTLFASFADENAWAAYDDRQRLQEMEKQAIAEQVEREHAKVLARVQKELESEQAKRSGGGRSKQKSTTSLSQQDSKGPSAVGATPEAFSETAKALDQATRDAQQELNLRRVRMRDTAKLMAAMISVLPEEKLQAITENVRGSHGIEHFEGAGALTVVRPHGRSDLTIPGHRARSIVWGLRDMLLEISRMTDVTRTARW